VLLTLVLVGWFLLADGESAEAHSRAGGTQPATVSDVSRVVGVTTARFAQGIQLTSQKGGTLDATMHVQLIVDVDADYKAVPPTSENGGVKLVSWTATDKVTGSLDSTCTPSPDPQQPDPCDVGYFGPAYQHFTCVAEPVDLSQFPSPLHDPLRADFPFVVGFQTYPSFHAVAEIGGGTLPYTDLFQWEGGPDCKRLDDNEDGGKLLAAHSLGDVPFGCSRTDEEVDDQDENGAEREKGWQPCSDTGTQHVANDGLGDSGTRTNDWEMTLDVIF
jgi:hypothetical protein